MAKSKEKKKRSSEPPAEDVPAVPPVNDMLKCVLDLGGMKADMSLFEDVNDDEEDIVMDAADDLDAEPIKKDDIMEFIQQLNIKEYRDPSFRRPQKEKPKAKLPKPSEEDLPSVQQVETSNELSEKKPKKKGNKFKLQHDEVTSTVVSSDTEPVAQPKTIPKMATKGPNLFFADYKPRKYLLMKTGSSWLDQSFPEDPVQFDTLPEKNVEKLRQFAENLYNDDIALYQDRKKSIKSDGTWMKTVVSSGTLGDKLAALTLMIQDACVHTLQQLDMLIAMVKKKGKRECFLALDNLKELFLTVWLPDNRKLRTFAEHPMCLLDELSSGNKDSRDRRLVVWYYEQLLKQKYEEFVICVETLSHDPLPAAKTKAISVVFELLVAKPEQEKRLLLVLSNKLGDPDHKIAAKCTHLLLSLLEKHPNMKTVVTSEVERILYRPNIAKKAQYFAVCFLNQMILSHEECNLASHLISSYFSFFKTYVKKGEVDSKMMSALLTGVNRAFPFAKDDRVKLEENMNTLYKVVHIVTFNTSIQALMLIYQVLDSSSALCDRYYSSLYRKILDPSLIHSSKQAMFLNLLFKTMKKDTSPKRIKAFVKRILQVSALQSPTFACSTLILVAEVLKAHPGLLDLSHATEESDEEEHFDDVADDEDEQPKQSSNVTKPALSSWVHRSNIYGKLEKQSYDPHHRNPLYACADMECIWELKKVVAHYHPSVVLFATNILQGQRIEYPGDPLEDFTLIRFLDRFVYRNPKKRQEIQKAVQAKKQHAPVGARALAINTEEYLGQAESKIPVDERFFYRYFRQRADSKKKKRKDSDDEADSDASSIEDDEFDDFLSTHEGQFEGEDSKIDFAGEFDSNKSAKKKKKRGDDSEESSDDDDDDDANLSDEEVELGDMDDLDLDMSDGSDADDDESLDGDESGDDEDFGEGSDDDDDDDKMNEEDIEFSDDNEEGVFSLAKGTRSDGKKRKHSISDSFSSKRGKKDDITSLFASAEQFSHLLEDNPSGKLDTGGSEALSNVKDKAGAKQLTWEMERDKWLRGADWKSKKRIGGKSGGRGRQQRKGGAGGGAKGRKKKW